MKDNMIIADPQFDAEEIFNNFRRDFIIYKEFSCKVLVDWLTHEDICDDLEFAKQLLLIWNKSGFISTILDFGSAQPELSTYQFNTKSNLFLRLLKSLS